MQSRTTRGRVKYSESLVFFIPSREEPAFEHTVDLLAYYGNGDCTCADFSVRCEPILKAKVPTTARTRCRHIEAALRLFADEVLGEVMTYLSQPEPEPK